MHFTSQNPQYEYLRKKLIAKQKALQENLWSKHTDSLNWLTKNIPSRHLALGGVGGLMLLGLPSSNILPGNSLQPLGHQITMGEDKNLELVESLTTIVPAEVRRLTSEEEDEIATILSEKFRFSLTAELNHKRLNRSYGVIGGEQHLYRYPGDNLYKHADSAIDWAMYGSAGIAPGLGAWGYFAPSEKDFTEKDKMREKYYLAVQTFLTPGFAENVALFRDFFKFRKMLVINPKTGQAVVAVIADAGPAQWTGKHLGGSPEVMHYLGLASGPRKGSVLYFFIDDPQDKIPLGPIKIGEQDLIAKN